MNIVTKIIKEKEKTYLLHIVITKNGSITLEIKENFITYIDAHQRLRYLMLNECI